LMPSNVRPADGERAQQALVVLGLLLFAAIAGLSPLRASADTQPVTSHPSERARWLEGRLFAPCCWNQTLDIHDSPLASELRNEISARLARGEPALAVEDDMAARFGERIRAVPRGRDPRMGIVAFIGMAMLLSAVGLVWLARRWMAKGPDAVELPQGTRQVLGEEADPYGARLDAELKALDS